ncbi:MAG: hypothetical protein WDO71_22920 [Bacteroidota bacterium]
MISYINQYNFKPGDEIIVPKSNFNLIQHHALYLGHDEQDIHWIIENAFGIGVTLYDSRRFFQQES